MKKQAELNGVVPPSALTDNDVRKGFVYKTVSHVTLKSIANNPDITEGMSREEIDAAIARHTDKEVLYDQPYEDPRRLRVTGPFTVESLSPHRTISEAEERPISEVVTTLRRRAARTRPPSSTTCGRPACRTPSRASG